jgi:hypothetical protein
MFSEKIVAESRVAGKPSAASNSAPRAISPFRILSPIFAYHFWAAGRAAPGGPAIEDVPIVFFLRAHPGLPHRQSQVTPRRRRPPRRRMKQT